MGTDKTTQDPISCAVITGGHGYDVLNFHRFFRGLAGVDAYIQHMDDFASARANVRDSYDVVLFYTMLMDGPTDDGGPWYAGRPKTALEHLGETEQGIVLLHHAILAYPQWPVWSEIAVSRIAASAIIPSRRCASRSPILTIRSPRAGTPGRWRTRHT